MQPYEDLLPYELFSVRVALRDVGRVRDILRGISDVQYRELLGNVLKYQAAFEWDRWAGGRAFDFTIASLRRRHLNLQAVFY